MKMARTMEKTFRIQLQEQEVRRLRNLLAGEYHRDRRNLRWAKERIKRGEPESRIYTIANREKHLAFQKHLLKKLSRYVGIKWFEE